MKKIFICLLVAVNAVCAVQAKEIKGTVKDTEGKGVAGVVVSDGLNTVQTDKKGRFEMDTDKDSRFVFISTPSGYVSATLKGRTLFYKEINHSTKSYDFLIQKNAKDERQPMFAYKEKKIPRKP